MQDWLPKAPLVFRSILLQICFVNQAFLGHQIFQVQGRNHHLNDFQALVLQSIILFFLRPKYQKFLVLKDKRGALGYVKIIHNPSMRL